MEGSLSTIALTDVLEVVHSNRGTGLLSLGVPQGIGRLPLELRFVEGEVVGGAILDWEGLEAVSTFPLHARKGQFSFGLQPVAGVPLLPFKNFMGEWARLGEQWNRLRTQIDSPSRVLDTPKAKEPYGVFMGGRSIRGAAKAWGVPLIIAMDRTVRGLEEEAIAKLRKYAWYGLRVRHPASRRTQSDITDSYHLTAVLDGNRNLGELIQSGISLRVMREYLVQELSTGELEVPGKGWLLRDLLWEMEAEESGLVTGEKKP